MASVKHLLCNFVVDISKLLRKFKDQLLRACRLPCTASFPIYSWQLTFSDYCFGSLEKSVYEMDTQGPLQKAYLQ